MKILPGLIYSFDCRDDVMNELLHGRDNSYLVGFECPACNRLHVVTFTPRLTAFSRLSAIHAPPSVQLTVEEGSRGVVPNELCPADGAPMNALRTPKNEWIFA